MKKIRRILLICLLCVCSVFASACYVTQAQTMKNIKGTYKLVQNQRTDEKFDGEGKKVSTVTDLIETQGLEVYLVVTGEQTGYYAYKATGEETYVKEVALTYETDEEKTDKYTFVRYKDAVESDFNSLGVTKNSLNFYRPSICAMLGKLELNQAGYNVRWEKVDKATDLSYVKKQWGEVPTYTYEGWAERLQAPQE